MRRRWLVLGLALCWIPWAVGARASEPSSRTSVSPKQQGARAPTAPAGPAAEGLDAEPPVAAAPPVAAPAAGGKAPAGEKSKAGGKGSSGGGGVNPGAGDKPLSVRSDELEAVEEGGARRMVFQRNVRVEQGDLVVNSERLEAHYPPSTNQPDKLYATGHVRIVQKDRVLTCDNATYYQADERLVCVGNSELTRGNDRVRGDQIEIYTAQNRVLVHGRAVVNVTPDTKETKPEPKKADAAPKAEAAP